MIFIQHRTNSLESLKALDSRNGVEIDLRSSVSHPKQLHVSHDPWDEGTCFKKWIEVFCEKKIQGPLILNTKEDGLEEEILNILDRAGITNFFFLDTTVPTLVKWTAKNLSNFAVRVSSFEPTIAALSFEKKVSWIWVDCFYGNPLKKDELTPLIGKFKICLVSPELQGISNKSQLQLFRPLASIADAICTKVPHKWLEIL